MRYYNIPQVNNGHMTFHNHTMSFFGTFACITVGMHTYIQMKCVTFRLQYRSADLGPKRAVSEVRGHFDLAWDHHLTAGLSEVTIAWTGCPFQSGPASGHGRLWEPPCRATMWRRNYSTPADYNDNQLFCGGKHVRRHHSASGRPLVEVHSKQSDTLGSL